MSLKLIVQFKDSVEQDRIESILQSDELKRIRWGSGLRAELIFDLPLNSNSEELRRLARSYEFNEYQKEPDFERMSDPEMLSTLKKMKKYLEIFNDIYFMQIETHSTPVETFKNY
ncbi:hypothetical protein HZA97_07395 [Candidatus Woesearchaeota archaeon]|nr:hypothetical protein [Candidatus Woesearchaeota archaeon]